MIKQIAIIGSTGYVGRQALELIKVHPEKLKAEVLTACSNYELLIEQARSFRPNVVVIADDNYYKEVFDSLDPLDIKVYAGTEAINQVIEMDSIHMVLNATSGIDGIKHTLAAIENKKPIALANRETLAVAGELIQKVAFENRVLIIPVGLEQSSIFQSLMGEGNNPIDKISITGSGGYFKGWTVSQLEQVNREMFQRKKEEKFGQKEMVNDATLMRMGLQLIETSWLFDIKPPALDAVIHPESVVRSLVYFKDGSVKTHMSIPDLKIPIQFAFSYPARFENHFSQPNLNKYKSLSFESPDFKNFRNLALAFQALDKGGNLPCILNASNDIAVQAFLMGRIGFLQIPEVIEECMKNSVFSRPSSLGEYMEADKETRRKAQELIDNYR